MRCWADSLSTINSIRQQAVRIRHCHSCIFLTFSLRPVSAFGGLLQTFRQNNIFSCSDSEVRFTVQTSPCMFLSEHFVQVSMTLCEPVKKNGSDNLSKTMKNSKSLSCFKQLQSQKTRYLDSFNCLFRFFTSSAWFAQGKGSQNSKNSN